jgi:hypothetical protein
MSIHVDFDGLKRLGKEFLDALPGANVEEAEAGWKCFSLAWLNCRFARAGEEIQALALLKIVSRAYLLRGAYDHRTIREREPCTTSACLTTPQASARSATGRECTDGAPW